MARRLGWQADFESLISQHNSVGIPPEMSEAAADVQWRKPAPVLPPLVPLGVGADWVVVWEEDGTKVEAQLTAPAQVTLRQTEPANAAAKALFAQWKKQTTAEAPQSAHISFTTCLSGITRFVEQCHYPPRLLKVVEPVEVQMNRAEDSGEMHELWLVQGGVVAARLGPLESISGIAGDAEMDAVAEQLQSMGINISADKLEALHNMGYTPERIIASLGHKACVEKEGDEEIFEVDKILDRRGNE